MQCNHLLAVLPAVFPAVHHTFLTIVEYLFVHYNFISLDDKEGSHNLIVPVSRFVRIQFARINPKRRIIYLCVIDIDVLRLDSDFIPKKVKKSKSRQFCENFHIRPFLRKLSHQNEKKSDCRDFDFLLFPR